METSATSRKATLSSTPKPVDGPINLNKSNYKNAAKIVQDQIKGALTLVNAWAEVSRTPVQVTLTPNEGRTRGLEMPEPFERGVKLKGSIDKVGVNSVMKVEARAYEMGTFRQATFRIQLASDNLAKPGVKIFSSRQIADLITSFFDKDGKTFHP